MNRRVALLAEGVDRNLRALASLRAKAVALLAEGVDRNCAEHSEALKIALSPSSRRAWIEIKKPMLFFSFTSRSPSSRRAWIEMSWISCIRCGR